MHGGPLGQSGKGKAREPLGPVASAAGKKNQSPDGTVEPEQAAAASSRGAEKQTADRTLEPEQAALVVTSVVKQTAGRTRKPDKSGTEECKGQPGLPGGLRISCSRRSSRSCSLGAFATRPGGDADG